MHVADAYSAWAPHYDSDRNLTRDLDAQALRQLLPRQPLAHVVEAGCGTGKNTAHLADLATEVLALDFSEGMLAAARQKRWAGHVHFQQADLSQPWPCASGQADLVSFNLVLEHVEHLQPVLQEAARVLRPGGRLLISELHPFKQYQHSQARFVDATGAEVRIPAFTHHLSDYRAAALAAGLDWLDAQEWWHAQDPPQAVPRLLTLLFQAPPATA